MATSTTIRVAGAIDAPTALGALNPLWSPSLLPGIAAAWDADTVTVDTATPPQVTAWPSTIGGLTMTGAAGTYPTKEGALNGKTPVRFTSGRRLAVPLVNLGGAPLAAFLFNLASAPSGTGQSLMSGGNGQFNILIAPNGELRAFLGSGTAPSFIVSGAGKVAAGTTLAVVYLDADGKHHLRINGVDVANAGLNFGTSIPATGRVGAYVNGNDPVIDGSIGSMVFGGGGQTLTDIQKLEGYLAQRFVGTAFLPAGHPYRSTPPRKLS